MDLTGAPSPAPPDDKAGWRRVGMAARRQGADAGIDPRDGSVAEVRDAARTQAALDALTEYATVGLYLSRTAEPDTTVLARRLFQRGTKVLVPVLTDGRGHGLGRPAWAWYDPAALREGLWGIPEPTTPVQPAEAIAQAEVVVCSALWVDRRGWRVGVGGGWYDRALGLRDGRARVWALVGDCEVVESLPHDPWDLRVDAVLTETGLHPLGS